MSGCRVSQYNVAEQVGVKEHPRGERAAGFGAGTSHELGWAGLAVRSAVPLARNVRVLIAMKYQFFYGS